MIITEISKAPCTTGQPAYLMRRRVSRLVKVDEAMAHVKFDGSPERGAPRLQWGVVTSSHYHTVIVLDHERNTIHQKGREGGAQYLEQERPLGSIQRWCDTARLDDKIWLLKQEKYTVIIIPTPQLSCKKKVLHYHSL